MSIEVGEAYGASRSLLRLGSGDPTHAGDHADPGLHGQLVLLRKRLQGLRYLGVFGVRQATMPCRNSVSFFIRHDPRYVKLHGTFMFLNALTIIFVSAVGLLVDTGDTPFQNEIDVPEGFEHRVIARQPLIQDPVAFTVDPDGRLLIAETERTNHGTMDNRSSPWHLEDDLQSMTVEDRVAYMEKWAHKRESGMDFYTEKSDRVRRTVDTDGDGVYDSFTIFAGSFNDVPDGIGSGVMTVGDEVWYTNIPHLWRLKDADGDGIAEIREPIQSGFGVRFALYGHDMHGLVPGPDGRIYWSIGDRGYHLETPDGRVLADPRSGAVFRCERDGTNLEVFATGLRNPQELAFNDVGDLFTGDNTSDAGDRARIVYIAEQGETGWTMDYQSLEGANLRGPWEQERIWEVVTPENAEFRPDWTLPPLAHVGAGPSGFVYDPGIGLPDEYADHFFMCDFTGSPSRSKIWTFKAVPDGAGYEVVDPRIFAQGMLNTDVDFDWDGRMLVSEWGGGWSATKRGAVHAISHPEAGSDSRIAEARKIAVGGMENVGSFELADLLAHPSRRLRLMAQYELADRGASDLFADVARYETDRHARVHAIWGLGEIARHQAARKRRVDGMMAPVIALLDDGDPEVRAQAAKVLGEPAQPKAFEALVASLADESPRVRYHAAMSLGRIGDPAATPYLVAMIAENDDRDRFLRHAGVVALASIGDRNTIEEMASSPAASLRRAAVLVMRRWSDPSLERLLFDPDPRIRTEAARAVHDLPVVESMPALASIADEYQDDGLPRQLHPTETPLLRRVVDANLRGGTPADLDRLASLAMNGNLPKVVRDEAMKAIALFDEPGPRDRVLGWWRPVENGPRDIESLRGVLSRTLPPLSNDPTPSVRALARATAGRLGVALDPRQLREMFLDNSASVEDRIACFEQLLRVDDPLIPEAIGMMSESDDPRMRSTARDAIAITDPSAAFDSYSTALASGTDLEKQHAILGLGRIEHESARERLEQELDALVSGDAESTAWSVEVLEAAEEAGLTKPVEAWRSRSLEDPSLWNVALVGGDVEAGRRVARYHPGASCMRCHAIEGQGGDAGPSLAGIGARGDRANILQSIVDPHAVIVEGYGEASAMPNMKPLLTPREVRDLVAYLATLTDEDDGGGH